MPGSTKHACPGVHDPMAEADGLLARIRVPGGRLTAEQWAGAARAAATHGSGVIELTSRANLQLRGIREANVDRLTADLVALRLVHPDAAADQRRNVLGAPATGLDPTELADVRGLVDEIAALLVAEDRPLHPKAGVLVDAGGTISVRGRSADVALGAVRRTDTGEIAYELVVGGALPIAPGDAVAVVPPGDAARRAVAVLADAGGARATELPDDVEWLDGALVERAAPAVDAPLGVHADAFVGAAPLLGRLDAALALDIAGALLRHGATDLRLTPARGLVVPIGTGTDAGAGTDLLADLGALGLITDPADPAACVIACAGRTGCAAGTADTIADGAVAIARLRAGPAPAFTVHLSGCSKRCASHAPHDLTLIADEAGRGYDGFDHDGAPLFRAVSVDRALEATGR